LEKVQAAYAAQKCRAMVRPFLTEMELALGAATLAVSRAGGSSLAELAAMRLPAILVPYPFAADNHQFYNARALSEAGAALLLAQNTATHQTMGEAILQLLRDESRRAAMSHALARWHAPRAAEQIAEKMLALMHVLSRGQWTVSDAPDRPQRSDHNDRRAAERPERGTQALDAASRPISEAR
jgi:UDP-N-acetylglucosamine--N-acetylmuramyl-(pentapeptide) pyrophosphoryl-undecaprenol N-acetylglucosamine transferase